MLVSVQVNKSNKVNYSIQTMSDYDCVVNIFMWKSYIFFVYLVKQPARHIDGLSLQLSLSSTTTPPAEHNTVSSFIPLVKGVFFRSQSLQI